MERVWDSGLTLKALCYAKEYRDYSTDNGVSSRKMMGMINFECNNILWAMWKVNARCWGLETKR